jgi:hypothetical protein
MAKTAANGDTSNLKSKPETNHVERLQHQQVVKESIIALPAFGLTLIAARVRKPTEADAVYGNYEFPQAPNSIAFTVKGALRLEMMNSNVELFRRYRRLFGSMLQDRKNRKDSKSKEYDLQTWRSRVYVQAYATAGEAAEAAKAMFLVGISEDPEFEDNAQRFVTAVSNTVSTVILFQINDVFLSADRRILFSDVLSRFLQEHSRLLTFVADLRILPAWKELVQ